MLLEHLFEKIGRGETLDPSEMTEFRNYARNIDETSKTVKDWQRGIVTMEKIRAKETEFFISPARSIVFTQTTVTSIPNNTYTLIDFTSSRGLVNQQDPIVHGCVEWAGGLKNHFTKKSWVKAQYPILFFGDFGFDIHATGSRTIFIEFFNKADVSLGGYTFSARAANSDWTNMPFCFMDFFNDGDYCEFWVWQDSGGPLGITSANFGFMLG